MPGPQAARSPCPVVPHHTDLVVVFVPAQETTRRAAAAAAAAACSEPAAPVKGSKRTRPAPLAGFDTDSQSDEEGGGDAERGQYPAAAAAADGAPAPASLTRLQLVARRLGRAREAVATLAGVQAQLLEKLREHHRRFALRHGHPGTKDGAAGVAAAGEALGLGPHGGCCVAPPSAAAAPPPDGRPGQLLPCTEPPLPLSSFCAAHILLDPHQVAYVPGKDGRPRLRQPGDAPPAAVTACPAAAAVVQASLVVCGNGGDVRLREEADRQKHPQLGSAPGPEDGPPQVEE